MAVGRPISLTPNIATKTLSSTATASQTSFTVTGGYRINELGVYRNGVRLVQGKDFTASDGSTVTLLSGATVNDIIDFQIFDSFNIADAINSVGDQTISGDLTATAFYGDGSSLTGVGDTAYIDAASLTVAGIATFNGVGNFDAEVTAAGGVDVTGGVKSAGIVSFTNTTASTSTTTGAVIVSGGVGIAGSLHVGENVSVGGTLTYEDVTNIDSVGIITAQTGVRITAGGLVVTAGVTTFSGADINIDGNAAGVSSVTWDASANSLIWKDNSKATFGDSSDLEIYHSGIDNFITADTQNLIIKTTASNKGTYIQSDDHVYITTPLAAETMAKFTKDGAVELFFDNAKKFESSPTGVVVTGVATASDYYIGVGGTSVHTALGTKASTGKAIAMAMVFG